MKSVDYVENVCLVEKNRPTKTVDSLGKYLKTRLESWQLSVLLQFSSHFFIKLRFFAKSISFGSRFGRPSKPTAFRRRNGQIISPS